MNTKSFNYFRNTFALIGFFIIACSVADEPSVEPEPPVQSNIGKYQIAIGQSERPSGWQSFMVVLNTQTGVSKTYARSAGGPEWVYLTDNDITFTH